MPCALRSTTNRCATASQDSAEIHVFAAMLSTSVGTLRADPEPVAVTRADHTNAPVPQDSLVIRTTRAVAAPWSARPTRTVPRMPHAPRPTGWPSAEMSALSCNVAPTRNVFRRATWRSVHAAPAMTASPPTGWPVVSPSPYPARSPATVRPTHTARIASANVSTNPHNPAPAEPGPKPTTLLRQRNWFIYLAT